MNIHLALLLAEGTEPVGVPGWVPVVIAIILLLLFWWGLSRNSISRGEAAQADDHHDDHETTDTAPESPEAHAEVHEPEPVAVIEELEPVHTKSIPLAETAVTPDDLKKVEGIGPKIEGILHEAGILTFAELAAASVPQLEKIVREDAGIRVAFPDTWPEQAQLAASGNWGKLEQLQDDLKGGRRR